MLKGLFHRDVQRRRALAAAQVVPEPIRCVQCGICSFSCPIGIDVRRHARTGIPVADRHCITCGECVARCPRGVLRFDAIPIFAAGESEGQRPWLQDT